MRARVAAVAAALVLGAQGCGGGGARTPPVSAPASAEPHWEDVFDTTPELVAILSPLALRSDPVYGPLLRRVIELAREQSQVVSQSRALDSVEDAEEVILGVRTGESTSGRSGRGARPPEANDANEVVAVLRGVRADVDPATLVDGDGKRLWLAGPQGAARELVRGDSRGQTAPVSLFELPGRTWVIASGAARDRARGVFARPLGRPALRFDTAGPAQPLALLRMDGPSLVAHIHALGPSGDLGAIGRRLTAVTLELPPAGPVAGEGLRPPAGPEAGAGRDLQTTLTYADEDAAAASEVLVRQVLDAIGRKNPSDLGWLGTAKVVRPGRRVVVTVPLPMGFVEALAHIGKPAPVPPASP